MFVVVIGAAGAIVVVTCGLNTFQMFQEKGFHQDANAICGIIKEAIIRIIKNL